jgi:hypothetical protein
MSSHPTRPDGRRADQESPPEPLLELTLGRRRPTPAEAKPPHGSTAAVQSSDAGLDKIEARCRLKAEAARWAAACQRRIRQGTGIPADDAPLEREVIEWADKLTDCFYWMNTPDDSTPDVSLLEDLGGCYEAVAEAVSLITTGGRQGAIERSLPLVAESQSSLRRALQRLQAPDDPDQLAAHEWVRAAAARHRLYLKRYMRAEDLADPTRWPNLLVRIEAMAGGDRHSRQQHAAIDRARHHLDVLRAGHGTDEDWQAVIETVDKMVGGGVAPSDREIRDLLLPVLDDLPDRDDLPHGFRLVMREIDRFLATRIPSSDEAARHEPTAEVIETRRLLGGRGVVLIGGACRPAAHEALKTALGPRALTWIETKEHQSVGSFEAAIAHPDVALVLLAIRWSSHAFGEVKRFCDRYDKPLVRLPGGYSPNQVAAQILAQCSGRLESR